MNVLSRRQAFYIKPEVTTVSHDCIIPPSLISVGILPRIHWHAIKTINTYPHVHFINNGLVTKHGPTAAGTGSIIYMIYT